MKGTTTKLSVNLPTESLEQVRDYAEDNGITMTEAIRRALGTQHFLANEVSKGGKILIEARNGSMLQLIELSGRRFVIPPF